MEGRGVNVLGLISMFFTVWEGDVSRGVCLLFYNKMILKFFFTAYCENLLVILVGI